MDTMNPNCCVISESFSSICGHVTTVIEHHRTCELMQFDPYQDRVGGHNLKFLLDYHPWTQLRLARAFITEFKCISCDTVEKGICFESFRPPPNTWISDVYYREISFAFSLLLIANRRKSWESYISDQNILFQRQKRFDDIFETAQQDLIAYNAKSGATRDEQALDRLESDMQRAETIKTFYDHHQNEYFLQFRGLKKMSMRLLFDPVNPTHLTFGLLRLVKPEEIPIEEVCGICTEVMGSESDANVMRLFCNRHLFHETCIIPWFNTANNNTVTCPMCRSPRKMYKPPVRQLNALNHE
ncbi:ring zinc finger [Botrytis cinerea]